MKLRVYSVFIILFLLYTTIKSQSLQLGFRVEPALLLIEENNENEVSFTPYSLYITTLIEPIDWLKMELRPGIFLASEEYSGFEIGAFARFMILPTNLYISAGLSNHSNRSSGHNTGGSYKKDMLYKGIGIGFQKDSKLSFDLMYFWTDDGEFAYSRVFDSLGNSTTTTKKMNGILKVGFSLAWDIL